MGEQGVLRRAYDVSFQGLMALVERDVVPDWLIRRGIRYLLSQRVAEVSRWLSGSRNPFHSLTRSEYQIRLSDAAQARQGGPEEQQQRKQTFVDELKSLPIAVQTSVANEQHYEVFPSCWHALRVCWLNEKHTGFIVHF